MNLRTTKQFATAIGFTFVAMTGVYAQSCPSTGTGAILITSSCDDGVTLSGGNLTIQTSTVSNPGESVIVVNTGTVNTIDNTATGIIDAGDFKVGIENEGTITTLNNTGRISAGVGGVGVASRDTITTLNNAGTISVGDRGVGIYNEGTITTLDNTSLGSISAGNEAVGIANIGTITNLTNAGTISGGNGGVGIQNNGTITNLTNAGAISGGADGAGLANIGGTITTLTNALGGTISAGGGYGGIFNFFGSIDTLNNAGTISGGSGTGINNQLSTITTLNNTGTISVGDYGFGIYNDYTGTITTLNNTGTISAGVGGVGIENSGVITTLNNIGTITAGTGGYGIVNNGTITTLINSQGGSTPLTYSGTLPNNYSIIVNSPSSYGKLEASNTSVSGVMSFGINSASTLSYNTIYSGVFNDISINNIENTFGRITLGSTFTWALAKRLGTEQIDLIVEPSDVVTTDVEQLQAILVAQGYALVPEDSDTEASLISLGGTLQGLFASQSAGLVNGMSYDCTVFGANNICVSAGGRFTNVSSDQFNTTSALIIGAYRYSPQIRFGAYLDQNLSSSTPGGIAQLSNANPMAGLFTVWSQKLDGTGLEAKLALGYVNKGLTLTRPEVGTSEPGSGSTSLSSQGAMAAFKYGMAIGNKTLVSPYAGLRYVKSTMAGYTEAQTAKVAFPLSYDAINNYVTTAIAGLTGQRTLNEKTSVFASAGLEKDLNTNISNLVTSGNGYFNIAMNGNYQNTRATASLGANYFLSPKERLSLVGIYRQEAYQAISSTTVMATYTVGL
ncbi:hypothetical protein B6A14_01760 [Polynucleobacter hirudinilacicola]|uniref:Autotransporter domain-containing protein n=1 Tax=Polynucleobacter hirudinilacicola TaxID=1743166 RepID=A0A210S0G5_9BURK|nr:autotransporter domain-containing protein [Polynucleobacter hirudinilacicola]OWF66728.1 hypothetical protein B6A14_01760 [Polynucleobacter hirudinilacicola]